MFWPKLIGALATHRLVMVCVVAMLTACASGLTASAQGGSAGGVIGKSDKSVSGSESAPTPRDAGTVRKATRSKAPAPAEPPKSKTAGCGRAVGTWFWVTEAVTIKADGSMTAKGGPGYWKCTDGLLHVYWPGFIVPHEIFSISDDGNRLIGQNTSSAPKRMQ